MLYMDMVYLNLFYNDDPVDPTDSLDIGKLSQGLVCYCTPMVLSPVF